MKRLLVIPARIGSKRIKNKNIKNFNGRPIISYSLKLAQESKLFNKIHVSTDSKKIKKIAEDYNLEVDFLRPKNISGDHVPIISVLKYVYNYYKKKNFVFDEIWSLSACAPLLKKIDLINASVLLNNNNNKIVLPITEYVTPIEWAFKIDKNNFLKPLKKYAYKIRSQDISKKFHDVGYFVGIPIKFFSEKKVKFDQNYIGYEIERNRAIDIDNLSDWKLAEAMYKTV
jgi:N-acylneuraminate cytidylyltransferase